MSPRRITFHAFASVKGGVGKSTLTVLLAKILAARGRVPVVIDCDLLGTSLADGLELCAPARTLLADGTHEVIPGTSGDYLSRDETIRLRRGRRDAPQMEKWQPVYLNELLDLEGATRWTSWAWRHQREDNVRYFPSSSIFKEVSRAWHWLYEEPFEWVGRLATILDEMMDELPELTDIVLDLPPGVVGFSHEAFVMLSHISKKVALPEGYPSWPRPDVIMTAQPYIVTTGDRNDMLPAFELWGRHLEKLPTLVPLVNRTNGRAEMVAEARAALGPLVVDMGIEDAVVSIEHSKALAEIFRTGDVVIGPEMEKIVGAFGLGKTS